jgi:hypothetical protein
MLEVTEALNACFAELSKEFDIEEVDSIPGFKKLPGVRIWKVLIPALVYEKAEDVEVYIRFTEDFPYSMPDVIFPDDRFKLLPHISILTRKLCLYEDGVVYDTGNIKGLIRDNIDKTRKWIETFTSKDNTNDYIEEIRNYWNEQYEGECNVDDFWILLGEIPDRTCELKGVAYVKEDYEKNRKFGISVATPDDDNAIVAFIKCNQKTIEFPILYISSLKIPDSPPFSMTALSMIDLMTEENDKNAFRKFVNHKAEGCVLFPIGLNYALGGVQIPKLNLKRKGFRNEFLTPFVVLTSFENKNKNLERLLVSVYSDDRIAERTSGMKMEKRSFLIAGLGSIGSNLSYCLGRK